MRKHLRSMLSHYWRPIVLKGKCEECGSTNNLEVHHIDAFRQFMYIYNVPENKEELTEEEIKKYEYLCLGYHFKEVRTYTLCNECHKKIHKKEGKTAIKESREITSYPQEERNRLLIETYANSSLSISQIVRLKKRDILNIDLVNKEELLEYTKERPDNAFIFKSRVGGNKALSTRMAQMIISKYAKGN